MNRLPGLYDVIGNAAKFDDLYFVPIVGQFDFARPKRFLKQHSDLQFLDGLMPSDLYHNDSLWVRARLIELFGVHHPSGHTLTTLLNFQALAIDFDGASVISAVPFLVADTFDGFIDDYGYSPDASIAFNGMAAKETQDRIEEVFWALLLSEPNQLGIYSDYWYFAGDDSLHRVSCDGKRFQEDFVGYLHPEFHDNVNDECHQVWWPFDLPRKVRPVLMSGVRGLHRW